MGRYIDWKDVTGRYQDASKKAGDGPMGSYWLTYAEAEVDGRLAPRYTTPFSSAPDIVKDLCIDLTYCKMHIQQEDTKPIRESLDERFKALLNGTLVLTTSGSVIGAAMSWSESEDRHTSFGPDDPVNWNISSAWATEVDDSRDL